MIFGCKKEAPENWNWHGMPGREFMYQIVANKKNDIDVDKFDYYKRDAYYVWDDKEYSCIVGIALSTDYRSCYSSCQSSSATKQRI